MLISACLRTPCGEQQWHIAVHQGIVMHVQAASGAYSVGRERLGVETGQCTDCVVHRATRGRCNEGDVGRSMSLQILGFAGWGLLHTLVLMLVRCNPNGCCNA